MNESFLANLVLTILFYVLQILINFLQVTGIAVNVNADWTGAVTHALGISGDRSFPDSIIFHDYYFG